MARTANGGFSFKAFQGWARSHDEELKVGAVVAAIAFFFTQGLPLWNEDYSQWLSQANGGFFRLLLRLISPLTSEPQTWGYADRPGQVLIYKILSVFFGTWGSGYFFVKSAVFGGLVATFYHWMRKLGIDRRVALLSLALFTLSANTMVSVIWHSDFGVYSQLILALILFWALPQIEKGPNSLQVYRKGLGKLPKPFLHFILIFFAAVYFGSKVRADVRLAPLILLAYLYLFRREKFIAHLPPFALTFLATLPWSGQMLKKLPPFIPGAPAATGGTFGALNLGRVFDFLVGDSLAIKSAPLSVLGGLGILFVAGLAVYGAYRLYEEKMEAPDARWGFFLVWFAFGLLVCGITLPGSASHPLRFTLIPLVPGVFLGALALNAALKEFHRTEWFRYAAYGVVLLQCGIHGYHDFQYRREVGRSVVMIEQIHSAIEHQHGNSTFVYAPGFAYSGYREGVGPAIASRKNLNSWDEVNALPAGNTFVATWALPLDSRFALELSANGCGSALFDRLASCQPGNAAALLKYVGTAPELAQADQLAGQGNLAGASQILEGYLKKEPSNLGIAFVQSLYAYRLGDFQKMELIYDRIGPYFESHPAVAYNWGLAKQGVQKFAEASKQLEKAYRMVPKDYSIGFNLADSYYRQGKKSRALATLDELLKVYPNNDPMKSAYANWSK